MTVIYVDILLALNACIDYILLCATARVLRLPTVRRRMIAGAFIGALSSLIILLPPLAAWLTILYKLAVAMLMVPVSFRVASLREFAKLMAVLFIISAVFAGICCGIWFFAAPAGLYMQSGVVYIDVPPLLLLLLTVISYLVLCLYDRLTRKRVAHGCAYRVEISDGEEDIMLRTLFDSGHSLCDSFSGAPVIIADRTALGGFARQAELATVAARDCSMPLRYIPFSSIGGNGILPAFRPPCATLYADNRRIDISGVWIAVTDTLGRGEYDALIGPDLAERAADR